MVYVAPFFGERQRSLILGIVDVLLRQRQLRQLTRLSPNHLDQNGIQQYSRSGAFGSTILRRLLVRLNHDFSRGQNPTERLDLDRDVSGRRCRLHHPRVRQDGRSSIFCCLFGIRRRLLYYS